MAIASAAVEIDSVAIMAGPLDRRMAMHYELWMPSVKIQKLLADPQKIFFILIAQCDTGADTCVTKEQILCLKGQRAPLQKLTVRLWHRAQRLIMHRREPPARAEVQPVRAQRVLPAQPLMQPTQIGKKMRICPAWSLQKPLKHPVMIAL